MTARLYGIADLPERLVGRWDELLAQSPVRSAFLSHAFCAAVEGVRGGVFVLHIQEGDGAEGFMPFQIRKGRALLGHAEKVGGSMSDYFGIVGNLRGPLDTDEILRTSNVSSLRFEEGVPELCPFRFHDFEGREGMRLKVENFEQFKNALLISNGGFVKSVLSRRRKLVRELGNVRFTLAVESVTDNLNRLIRAKRDQYLRTGTWDALAAEWQRRLLGHLVCMDRTRNCSAVISTLEAGGNWIASKLSLICHDVLHSWFSVYDPKYRAYGSGHLLWFSVIENGVAKGLHSYDFGAGSGGYKAEYRGQSYDLWNGAIRLPTPRGRSERVIQAVRWRLEDFGRKRTSEKIRS
jgi:CelD/BcsL family acetyltransferase involved in cellulose biosynthesis